MYRLNLTLMDYLVKKYLDSEAVLKILDVGSCDVYGSYKRLFRNDNWTYAGLDRAPGRNVDLVMTAEDDWGVAAGSYDVVVSGHALEHYKDMDNFVAQCKAITTGKMILAVPCMCSQHGDGTDYWRLLPDGIRYLCADIGGFTQLECGRDGSESYFVGTKPV